MQTILQELAAYAAERTANAKRKRPLFSIRADAEQLPKGDFRFEKALRTDDIAFICECKKASPSKGLIAPDFPYLQIAKDYEAAGADCISVLTEPSRFLGNDRYLAEIAQTVKIPCLRKDFTVDPYMIYEAKLLGASAVLLICALLDKSQLLEYHNIVESLGLSALVEAHTEQEIETAAEIGAKIIGVNNRNLHDFSVNTDHASRLRQYAPAGTLFVTESGMKTPEDIQAARDAKADAVLIGETLMRAPDKAAMLRYLKGTNE
ncbi:MAG: indole-3-glycerol phosphate synthase TrpC [Oscillospiraceae bacterium]|nr:indole-3-glycerol phosphate synthase TrpC [Oscillospiraceae bacterium]MBR5361856.1 indole-3-glycerol phosphate synthase TrpC [Oscillospiraceae bacterium]